MQDRTFCTGITDKLVKQPPFTSQGTGTIYQDEVLGGHFKARGGHLTHGTHRISDTAFHFMIPMLLVNRLAAIFFYYMGAFCTMVLKDRSTWPWDENFSLEIA